MRKMFKKGNTMFFQWLNIPYNETEPISKEPFKQKRNQHHLPAQVEFGGCTSNFKLQNLLFDNL